MNTVTPFPHSAEQEAILDRHAHLAEGALVAKLALGITATTDEEEADRIAMGTFMFGYEQREEALRQEAKRAGITSQELQLHDGIVVGRLLGLFQRMTRYL